MHWRIEIRNGGYLSVHGRKDATTFYGADGKRLHPGAITRTWGEVRIDGPSQAEVVLEPLPGSRVAVFDGTGVRELKP